MGSGKTFLGIPLGKLGGILAKGDDKKIRIAWAPRKEARSKIIALQLSPVDRSYYLTAIDSIPPGDHFATLVEIVTTEAELVAKEHPATSK